MGLPEFVGDEAAVGLVEVVTLTSDVPGLVEVVALTSDVPGLVRTVGASAGVNEFWVQALVEGACEVDEFAFDCCIKLLAELTIGKLSDGSDSETIATEVSMVESCWSPKMAST